MAKRKDAGGARRLVIGIEESCPTIMAGGVGSVNCSQYTVGDMMPKLIKKKELEKPLYRVPLMAEVAALSRNGLTVASTFSGCGGSCTGYRMAGFRVGWANEFVPVAQDSYRANMAEDGFLDPRDIKLVQPEEILEQLGIGEGDLDLFDGSPPCFVAGTPVTTLRGIVPIEAVVPGDMVLTHKCRWRPVVRVGSKTAPTITVDGRIECTADHRFYATRLAILYDSVTKNYKDTPVNAPEWLAASEIEGHRCATPVTAERVDLPTPPIGFSYDEDFWYMVGRWVGDGWLRLDPGEVSQSVDDRPKQNKELAEWLLKWFGRGAGNKTLPGWCLAMPKEHRLALFTGYDEADGDGKQATTISRCLAVAVNLLANSLGKTVGISGPYQNKNAVVLGRSVNARPQWQIRYNDDDGKFTQVESGLRWKKIRRKTKPGAAQAVVYDIEVAEDHSFVADTFVVHNCQAFSTAGKRHKGWGEVKRYEGGGEQLNETLFQQWLRLLRGLMPKTFIAENVSGLVKGTCKGMFLEILAGMKAAGYRVSCRVLDAQWLGVPQMRQRAIFVGVRDDLPDRFQPCHPKPLPWRYSVREAIPWIAGVRQDVFGGTDVRENDGSRPCSTIALNGLGAAREYQYSVTRIEREAFDALGPTLAARWDRLVEGEQDKERFSLIRVTRSEPCPSILASGGTGMASVAHPTERRKFSIAELRRLCAFPDDFVLIGSYAQQWERLGNSVPPVMAFWIARTLRDQVLLPLRGDGPWPHDPSCLIAGTQR